MSDQLMTFTVEVDTATGTTKLKRFGQEAEQTFNKTEGAVSRLKSSASGWAENLLGPASAVAAGFVTGQIAIEAFNRAVNFVTSSVQEFAAAERAGLKLKQAFRGLGVEADEAADRAAAFADRMSMVTAVDDDAIVAAQQLLVSIGRLSGEGLERATKAALDMAAATGKDLGSAAEAVARAMEGSTRGLKAFGIEVDENLPPMERLNALLEQSATKFGGMAAAAGEGTAAALDKSAIAWGNFKGAVGEAAVQATDFNERLDTLTVWIDGLRQGRLDYLDSETEAIANSLDQAADALDRYNAGLERYKPAYAEGIRLTLEQGEALEKAKKEAEPTAAKVYTIDKAYAQFFDTLRKAKIDELLPFGKDVPYMDPRLGGGAGPLQPGFGDMTPGAPNLPMPYMLPPTPSGPGEIDPWQAWIDSAGDFSERYERFVLEMAGFNQQFAEGFVGVYDAIGASADTLEAVLGKNNSFAKGMRKIQATMLYVTGIISIYEGAVKIAQSIWPFNPAGMASGAAMVAKGAAAVAQARSLGASGGGGGTAAASGGGGGRSSRDQAVATSPTGQGAQKTPAPVVNVYVEGSVTAQTDLARTIAEEIRRQYGRAGY